MSHHATIDPTSPEFLRIPPEMQQKLLQQDRDFAEFNAKQNGDYLSASTTSPALLRANRANAQLSTGPRTLAGKEISKLNAVRHGLTGRLVLLPGEEADLYTAHVERFGRDFAPAAGRELELVQMLADTQWRINRIPGLESSIFALGRLRHADLYYDVEHTLRNQLIDCHTLEQNEKQLNNLSIQEGRLRRQYAKDLQELKALQSERLDREQPKIESHPELPSLAVAIAAASSASSNALSDETTKEPKRVRFYEPSTKHTPGPDQTEARAKS